MLGVVPWCLVLYKVVVCALLLLLLLRWNPSLDKSKSMCFIWCLFPYSGGSFTMRKCVLFTPCHLSGCGPPGWVDLDRCRHAPAKPQSLSGFVGLVTAEEIESRKNMGRKPKTREVS